jgi:hypothetical protein
MANDMYQLHVKKKVIGAWNFQTWMLLLPTVTVTTNSDNPLKVTVTAPHKVITPYTTSSDFCLSSVCSLILSVISLPEVGTEAYGCPLLRFVIIKQLVKAD